jgi:hypothetical protein
VNFRAIHSGLITVTAAVLQEQSTRWHTVSLFRTTQSRNIHVHSASLYETSKVTSNNEHSFTDSINFLLKYLQTTDNPTFTFPHFTFFRQLQHFFMSLRFPYIHNALFTLSLRFWNFTFPCNLHLYSPHRRNISDIKWRLLSDCLYMHVLSHTTVTICWSAIQLRRIYILLYRTKMAFLVWQSQ